MLSDDYIYVNLLALEYQVNAIVNSIEKYADKDILNGTCFKGKKI